jgi:hypothetical protein
MYRVAEALAPRGKENRGKLRWERRDEAVGEALRELGSERSAVWNPRAMELEQRETRATRLRRIKMRMKAAEGERKYILYSLD